MTSTILDKNKPPKLSAKARGIYHAACLKIQKTMTESLEMDHKVNFKEIFIY